MNRVTRALMFLLLLAATSACRSRVAVATSPQSNAGADGEAGPAPKPPSQPGRASADKQPPAAKLADPDAPRRWRLRAQLDSGEVRTEVTEAAAMVEVVAPTGTFLLAYPRSTQIEDWARAIDSLSRAPMADGTTASIPLRHSSDARVTWRFTRHAGRPIAPYTIAGTNTAWEFVIDMTRPQLDMVVAALAGDTAGTATAFDLPEAGRGASGKPMVDGFWLWNQVDAMVAPLDGPAGLHSPPSVASAPDGGEVKLRFAVDTSGRVIPSSIFLIPDPNPDLARTSRDALLRARYVPARRQGIPVPALTVATFHYRPH